MGEAWKLSFSLECKRLERPRSTKNISCRRTLEYIAAAKAARFEVVGYYFKTELEAALGRNSLRTGKELIPAKGVVATFRRMEPPEFKEGFDRLYTAQIGPTSEWSVTLRKSGP